MLFVLIAIIIVLMCCAFCAGIIGYHFYSKRKKSSVNQSNAAKMIPQQPIVVQKIPTQSVEGTGSTPYTSVTFKTKISNKKLRRQNVLNCWV